MRPFLIESGIVYNIFSGECTFVFKNPEKYCEDFENTDIGSKVSG